MARGMIGGLLTGGLVSLVGLASASLLSEQPAGNTSPSAPLVQAPDVMDDTVADANTDVVPDVSTPVGSLEIEAPQTPALPEGEVDSSELSDPVDGAAQADAPRADTDPLDEPQVVAIEGAMDAPETPQSVDVTSDPVEPVLPSPQSNAPQTPDVEADLSVSTAPAAPTVVIEPEVETEVEVEPEVETAAEDEAQTDAELQVAQGEDAVPEDSDDFFVVDLGAGESDVEPALDAPDVASPQEDDPVLADAGDEVATGPRLQLQGGENTLLGDRETGVVIRRPGANDPQVEPENVTESDVSSDALTAFAADAGDIEGKPLMSIVLIDDGSMSAASAALAGLPFPVTIAIDPASETAAEMMAGYRADGFEIAVMAMLPEGAVPSDVEVTFESVFRTLPESVAVLDIGSGGLQTDRGVTEQAMEILAAQGRGFVTVSQGLNMAGRAAEAAGVPAAVVYRDLDDEGQDARVVRRFVDQAAFRARQESGVVLVGRVRPDTISALILWGTANQDGQVAIVPVSAVLSAQ